jgi:transcriptional regulator with XRE-family HTH domain
MKNPMSDEKTVSPAQCRAGRALVEWTRDDLAEASRTAKSTLADFEAGKRQPHPRTLAAIRAALEAAGVEFTAETDAVGPGVRLKKNPI